VAGYQDSRISGKRIEDRISELENLRIGKKKAKPPPAQDWGLYKSAQE